MRRVWIGAAVVAVLALTGCANPLEAATEKFVENQLSQDGASVDIDADGEGGMTIEDDGATYQQGSHAKIPDDFPSGLPIPDGDLLVSAKVEGAWSLSFGNASRAEFDKLVDYFESGGYEQTSAIDMEGMASRVYTGSEWNVNLGLMGEDDNEMSISYMVFPVTE